ncbi:MAG: kelch-like protein, partial [Candidatus Krumholzibacteria bacterium]|nr:kelch-like protein [Candidatus Krumholzibacteria bacterium]
YDPVADSWAGKSAMSIIRGEAADGVIDGKLYVVGGVLQSDAISASLEVYDPATDGWTTRKAMGYVRAEATAEVINGKLYVVGGYR